jgi:hypothetical protein
MISDEHFSFLKLLRMKTTKLVFQDSERI